MGPSPSQRSARTARLAVLASVAVALSGCLAGEDGPVGEHPEGADGATGLPHALAGAGCDTTLSVFYGPPGPAADRAPAGFQMHGNQSFASHFLYVHHCQEVRLGDQIATDAWFGTIHVRGEPADNTTKTRLKGYVVEAFTDWLPLADAWNRDGVETRRAEFEADGDATLRITGEAFTYVLSAHDSIADRTDMGDLDIVFFAHDGTPAYDYHIVRPHEEPLLRAAVLQTQGGFFGEVSPTPLGGALNQGTSTVRLAPHAP